MSIDYYVYLCTVKLDNIQQNINNKNNYITTINNDIT